LSKVCFDVLIIFVESLVFGIIAYFLAGMRTEVSPIAGKS
jgi:hypothetical protein